MPQASKNNKDDNQLAEIGEAFDSMEVDPSVDLKSMKEGLDKVMKKGPNKGKGPKKTHTLSPESRDTTSHETKRPARRTRGTASLAASNSPEGSVQYSPEISTAPSSSGVDIASAYPRNVPDADSISQRALDEISVTSTQLREELDDEKQRRIHLEKVVSELQRSHAALATDHEKVKSLLANLTRAQQDASKRGTTSIQSARDVLAAIPSTVEPGSSSSAGAMLPPPPPHQVKNNTVGSGSRPSRKPT
jgi:hypothetical protein